MSFSLSWLLDPSPQDRFVSEVLGNAHLYVNRSDHLFYEKLLSEPALEFILLTSARTPGALEILAEGDRTIRPQSHAHAIEAFRNGKSLRVDGIHRFSDPIMTLCRSLEVEIGSHVNANLYLTPGAGKKALSRHYDTHDVFVLQVHGNKIWRLYEPGAEKPLEYLPLQRLESLRAMKAFRLKNDQSGSNTCALTDEFTMKAGDLLYLPRGFWHEAESEPDRISCHLTLGIQPTTYLDLITVAISQAAFSIPALRASLPHGYTVKGTAAKEAEQRLDEILTGLRGVVNAREAVGQLTSIFARSQGVGMENGIFQPLGFKLADTVTTDTVLRLRKGVIFGVAPGAEPSRLVFGSKVMAISPPFEEACRYLAGTKIFTPSQLPGALTSIEQLTLAKQLVSEGLLIVDSPKPPVPADANWIPTRINLKQRTVEWIDLGTRQLTEPFLHQTVNRMRKNDKKLSTRSTSLRELRTTREAPKPSGFIFHMSRCGSTLLANSLKHSLSTTVVSEPQPIGAILETLDGFGESQCIRDVEGLLKGTVRAYDHRQAAEESSSVLKFSSWHLLHISTIRRYWPDVPVVIMVREPIEVAVSCLDQKPGWMKWRRRLPKIVSDKLDLGPGGIGAITDEIFCARMLGAFLDEAKLQADLGCRIVDYRDLNASTALDIAAFFGVEMRPEEKELISKSFLLYSKDPEQRLPYVDDSLLKREKASRPLREATQHWAQPQYDSLVLDRNDHRISDQVSTGAQALHAPTDFAGTTNATGDSEINP